MDVAQDRSTNARSGEGARRGVTERFVPFLGGYPTSVFS